MVSPWNVIKQNTIQRFTNGRDKNSALEGGKVLSESNKNGRYTMATLLHSPLYPPYNYTATWSCENNGSAPTEKATPRAKQDLPYRKIMVHYIMGMRRHNTLWTAWMRPNPKYEALCSKTALTQRSDQAKNTWNGVFLQHDKSGSQELKWEMVERLALFIRFSIFRTLERRIIL